MLMVWHWYDRMSYAEMRFRNSVLAMVQMSVGSCCLITFDLAMSKMFESSGSLFGFNLELEYENENKD